MQLHPSAIWANFDYYEPNFVVVVIVSAAATDVVAVAVVVDVVVVISWFWAHIALGCNCTGMQLHRDAITLGRN